MFSISYPPSDPGSSLRSHIAFSCHDVSVSFNLEMFHSFLRLWWHWRFGSIQTSYFIDCSSIWACLIFMIQVGNFQQKQHGSDVVPFSADHIQITLSHMWCQCVPWLRMLTLIVCLSNSSILLIIFLICNLRVNFSPCKYLVHTNTFSPHVNCSIPIVLLLVSFLPKGREVFLSLTFTHSFFY